ncbi:histone deacetylase Rpd3p [Trichomonascus vanleenenianus]|uniref:histone deacetylase Rpd3p n=1 Tax=Trichomonascus vanleenenianus TaxID=2268995 RepID=UPI003ECAB301
MRSHVAYVYSPELIKAGDKLPSNEGRASRVHALIDAFGLTNHLDVICPAKVTAADLARHHDRRFVDVLLSAEETENSQEDYSDRSDSSESSQEEDVLERYGLSYDCPVFPGLKDYVLQIAGATMACVEYLVANKGQNPAPVAINWTGGRHHARRARAAGFCYINDIALAVAHLRRSSFDKIMCIDLDLHHGDGVEGSFAASNKVLCVSVHRYDAGFYPGTGKLSDRGKLNGVNYTINLPTRRGLSDKSLRQLVDRVIRPAKTRFAPDALVITCGCDGLTRDVHRQWNLTVPGYVDSLIQLLRWEIPTLLLSGGGYHHADTARCLAAVTSAALGCRPAWTDIPDHEYYDDYKEDSFEFDVPCSLMADENDQDYIDQLVHTFEPN